MFKIHTMFSNEINSLYQTFRKKFEYYQVEYRDTNEAIDILRYENFMPSLANSE